MDSTVFRPNDVIVHGAFGRGVVTQQVRSGRITQLLVIFDEYGAKKIAVSPPHDRLLKEINGHPYISEKTSATEPHSLRRSTGVWKSEPMPGQPSIADQARSIQENIVRL